MFLVDSAKPNFFSPTEVENEQTGFLLKDTIGKMLSASGGIATPTPIQDSRQCCKEELRASFSI